MNFAELPVVVGECLERETEKKTDEQHEFGHSKTVDSGPLAVDYFKCAKKKNKNHHHFTLCAKIDQSFLHFSFAKSGFA